MLSYSIRPADKNDAEVVSKLGRTTFLAAHEASTPKEDMEQYLELKFSIAAVEKELADSNNVFQLLYSNEKPAGYSKIIYNSPCSFLPENPDISKMERLYISKEFYDKKLGYKLFAHNKELCLRNNQTGIWLTVWVENDRAVAFYDRLGFKIIGEVMFKVGSQQSPNYVMWLEF
ncbi:MAG: GNAT family N-acetyltransferase [Bacteroidota bacterium]|nr:GNAT family N-acetyltransferase [Bacteroidota bacterium]